MWQKSYDSTPILYLIATPIGNLEDITIRSINILKEVSVVFSEDTRVTRILLNHYNINKKLISLHEHNEEKQKNLVLDYLKKGESVGLVTDRGTPIISDPGYLTVKYVIENNYNVVSLPGPCALISSLITSGIDPQPFLFYGFLNSKDSQKRKELINLKDLTYAIIFYEAPHRIIKTMNILLEIFGNRKISISREISKKYESIYHGDIKAFISNETDLKGEFVIVVEGKLIKEETIDSTNLNELVEYYIKKGLTVTEAIKKVAEEKNVSKNKIYNNYHSGR